ncbi:MAG: peptide chain release factor N(5)-glutamine methyltransferase [Candidatus Improbicoccus devescovinae]|nr:MAG: peptide chain release factor N(5)-glutamine methyltransferase [Candidatus Improbicoccus devescovinae]
MKLSAKKMCILPEKNLRPTTSKVKESLFNIVQFDVKNSVFLDLFAGTGQIGLEAANRKAKKIIFVEKDNLIFKKLQYNINKTRHFFLNSELEIFHCDAFEFVKNFTQKIDIAFLDPPYYNNILINILPNIICIMNKNGIIITESLYKFNQIQKIEKFQLQKRYKYGRISLNLYLSNFME